MKFIYLLCAIIISGCAAVPFSPKNYYQNNKKVGVIITKLPKFEQYPLSGAVGSPGAVGAGLSIAESIEKRINDRKNSALRDSVDIKAFTEAKEMVAAHLKDKGKDVVIIDEELNYDKLPLNKADPKLFKRNISGLCENYQVDELFVLDVTGYGLLKKASTFRSYVQCYAYVVDAKTNTYIWKPDVKYMRSSADIEGDWERRPGVDQYLKSLDVALKKIIKYIIKKMDSEEPVD